MMSNAIKGGGEEEKGSEVVLHVYDLTGGMARQLSEALIGKRVEGVWHTGVVVHGREYFWGGDLTVLRAGATVYGRPTKVVVLGTTFLPVEVIDQFVDELRPQYNPATYSLLSNNCNNFSNEMSFFLTGHGIPQDIVGLPAEILATPLGAAFKPIIQRLEQQQRAAISSTSFMPPTPPPSQQQQQQQQQSPQKPIDSSVTPSQSSQSSLLEGKGVALLSTGGGVKSFVVKMRSHGGISEDVLAELESKLSSSCCSSIDSSSSVSVEAIECVVKAMNSWEPLSECVALYFVMRLIVLSSCCVSSLLSSSVCCDDCCLSDLLSRALSRPFISTASTASSTTTAGGERTCQLLSFACCANLFATPQGTEFMISNRMMPSNTSSSSSSSTTAATTTTNNKVSVMTAALEALQSHDAGLREMAAAVVHNLCAMAGEALLDLDTVLHITTHLSSALLQLHSGEDIGDIITSSTAATSPPTNNNNNSKAAEAEYRMMMALGRLVAHSPPATRHALLAGGSGLLAVNDSLQAFLIARAADPLPSFPRIPKLASELCQIIFFQ